MSEKIVQPPYSNRGVESTSGTGMRACVDWLQVTFKNLLSVEKICDLIGLDFSDFQDVDSGKYGFSGHYRFGNISVYYHPDKPYLHLEMTGQGCRQFEQLSHYSWTMVFSLILMLDVNITRLDLALDDFKGFFTLDQIKSKVRRAHIRSRFKKARILEEYELSDGTNVGETVYFGRPQSDIQVRFYNKKLEREAHDYLVLPDHWIRTELQLRDERAKAACTILSQLTDDDEIGKHIAGMLKNYIAFLVENRNDSNKKRWKVVSWWEKFLGDIEKLRLTQIAPDATIERSKNWLEKSVSASFATVLQAYDYDIEFILDLIEKGIRKKTKKHNIMLNTYRELNGQNVNKQQKNKDILFETLYKIKNDLNSERN